MSEEPKSGTDWQADELDLIVADYFAMLTEELAGRSYRKSAHRAALVAQTGRSNGSVEFKFQNISAVLDELGMSWISGYKPRKNYQSAILDAIDRHLTNHPGLQYPAPAVFPLLPSPAEIFVPPPVLTEASPLLPERLRRLVGKFDPIERDHRNRALGRAGESFVVDLERSRLTEADQPDLARKVRWVAVEDGDGAGYDVLSFNLKGQERLLEVKTTNGSALTPFFLTRNECDVATERPEEWRIFRVHLYAMGPRIFSLAPPLENSLRLTPQSWRASF